MKTTIEKNKTKLSGCHVGFNSYFILFFRKNGMNEKIIISLIDFFWLMGVSVGVWMETINLSLSLCDTKEV
jgi:hypothetical protein